MDAVIARILDANLNRTREALRVLEEYARFGLDDARLAGELKAMRHDLAAAVATANFGNLLAARDTPGDVGTQVAGAGEYRRQGAGDVLAAAGKRLSEALRALEEYGKTQSQDFAARVETLRYRGYEIEKRLLRTVQAIDRFAGTRLYVLITEKLCRRPWREVLAEAAAGGASCFQLREPEFDDAALFARAEEFVAACRSVGALSIINDRADVAAAVRADGVHVGQRDLPAHAARMVVGSDRIIGVSTHTSAELDAAIAAQPDYIAVGPMHSTALKPEYGVSGVAYLRDARPRTALPVVAIGGIDADNAAAVFAAGASCVAVCTSIIGSDDPRRVAASILAQIP